MIRTGCGTSAADNETVIKVDLIVSSSPDVTVTDSESDTFYGVLMDGCRESRYGLDILQPDGTWVFYMFDEKGQQLTLEYLNATERQDGLYVTVAGTLENEVIKVISIKES